MVVTAYHIAKRFLGFKEVDGSTANPIILGMLQLDSSWPSDDSVPWCSAFTNYICWLLGLDRSKDLRARSWLLVGKRVDNPDKPESRFADAAAGFDIVILKRGQGEQPDDTVIDAAGHVGFFAGFDGSKVMVLGGNQSNMVSIAPYHSRDILQIRRVS